MHYLKWFPIFIQDEPEKNFTVDQYRALYNPTEWLEFLWQNFYLRALAVTHFICFQIFFFLYKVTSSSVLLVYFMLAFKPPVMYLLGVDFEKNRCVFEGVYFKNVSPRLCQSVQICTCLSSF